MYLFCNHIKTICASVFLVSVCIFLYTIGNMNKKMLFFSCIFVFCCLQHMLECVHGTTFFLLQETRQNEICICSCCSFAFFFLIEKSSLNKILEPRELSYKSARNTDEQSYLCAIKVVHLKSHWFLNAFLIF